MNDFDNNKNNNPFPAMEEAVLDFWDKGEIFKKSVEKSPNPLYQGGKKGDYVFYDGPPFATGEPHYGHLLSSIAKDVIPRFWTMRGYRVERRWGWDCHGLPIENIIEKDLKISGKKEIEKIGISEFCETCRSRVLEYADIWETVIRRIGRWVEFKNSYKTMDLEYMESVWWGFKKLWDKDLIYRGRKVQLYCPRCETPISNFEVAMDNSYKDITETSVYAKFKVKSQKSKVKIEDNTFILAWTTTPWTLPGNVALAVGEEIEYVIIGIRNQESGISEKYIIAKERTNFIADKFNFDLKAKGGKTLLEGYGEGYVGQEFKIKVNLEGVVKGKDLVGLEYEPLFDVPALKNSGKNVYKILAADFVTTEDGTGVVHTAVVYGEDDYNLGLKHDLPVIPALDEKGHFNETVPQFKGVYFKRADKLIIDDLAKRGLVFATEQTTHSYPFCHRCETQLFYNAIPAWFIAVRKLKKRMLELNERINWFPEYLKRGRFALGIEQAPDWNISRNRYFGTPIPVWRCETCGRLEVVGSVKELKEKSGTKNIDDIHIHRISQLFWKCSDCGGGMKRISEVLDCWVESGSMPFAQLHYPFENKEKFEKNFPAQFISEYISQTRAWFYVMHVMATALFDSHSFENVIATGVILNDKGEKLSKSKKNYPDPLKVIGEYGVDALRFYLMSSGLMQAENLFFNERDLRDVFRKNIMILWNVYKFYATYYETSPQPSPLEGEGVKSENILDKWILARLNQLIAEVTEGMNGYNLPRAVRPISEFINDLSTWYLRRSRDRFKSDNTEDKQLALMTTKYVLIELAKVMAPFTPFMAETIWQKTTNFNFKEENRSVHLASWPEVNKADSRRQKVENILEEMDIVRLISGLGLAVRDQANIKVRQPLNKAEVSGQRLEGDNERYLKLIRDELNVKKVEFVENLNNSFDQIKSGKLSLALDTEISIELKQEGLKREIVRLINNKRKQKGLTIKDKIVLLWQSNSELIKNVFINIKMVDELKKDTLSEEIIEGEVDGEEVKVNGERVRLEIKKI